MKCPRCDKPINDGESYCPHCGYKLEKKKSRTWIMIGGVVLAGVVLGSVVAQTGYHAFEKQVSETQGELTADPKDALPDQKTIEANKKKNETERKQEEQQEQEDKKEAEITISVDEATPVDLDSYVQIQPVSSKASSELDDNTAEKAIDGQEVTSWQEDVAGYGQGEI